MPERVHRFIFATLPGVICIECRQRRHKTCKAGTWCDCQHDPRRVVGGRLVDWTSVVGEAFAARSNPASIDDGVLTIDADDETTRHALVNSRRTVVKRVNAELGEGTITSLSGRIRPPAAA